MIWKARNEISYVQKLTVFEHQLYDIESISLSVGHWQGVSPTLPINYLVYMSPSQSF